MNRFEKVLSVITVFIFFSSCQDILECVINRHPELPNKRLQSGQVNNYYFEEIKAQIKNEPRDYGYYYYFSIDGDLPRGLEFVIDYRSVIIEGIPLDPGRYTFTVHLNVEQTNDYFEDCENEFNDCDGLCDNSTIKTYILSIR